MGRRKKRRKERAEPKDNKLTILDVGLWDTSKKIRGYNSLADTPEIKAGVEKIAEIISTMTIHLMQNGELGDTRLIDGLAKKIDINPNSRMTRQLFISWIVQEMILRGNAIVIPETKDGILINLNPEPKKNYTFFEAGKDYEIHFNNGVRKASDEVLNFRYNPKLDFPWIGQSQEIILADLIGDLKQANSTVSDFMKNKMLPSIVVSVDAMTEEMTTEAGKTAIEKQYISRAETGAPWIIPANLVDIKEIKPLSLKDIAIHDSIKISKQTAASILGMPAFLLGVGAYSKDEYNNFIRTKIAVICKAIEQELTSKLIIANDRYFQFNRKSMLNYDLKELGDLYTSLYTKGLVIGNEVRDALGMSPREELEQLVILENFIPQEKIGDQNKLGGGEEV